MNSTPNRPVQVYYAMDGDFYAVDGDNSTIIADINIVDRMHF